MVDFFFACIPITTGSVNTLTGYAEQMAFKNIGKKIQEAREEKGMTQVDLARALGITQAALSNYELGKRRLYIHQIETMAGLLDKSISFFVKDMGNAVNDGEVITGENGLEQLRNRVVDRISRLSENDLQSIDEYITYLEWRQRDV